MIHSVILNVRSGDNVTLWLHLFFRWHQLPNLLRACYSLTRSTVARLPGVSLTCHLCWFKVTQPFWHMMYFYRLFSASARVLWKAVSVLKQWNVSKTQKGYVGL